MMLIEEIRQIKESRKDLRKFGLTVGAVMIAIAVILVVKRSNSAVYWGSAGLLLFVLSISVPGVLKPLNKIWMTFALVIGWVMTRVILAILFYIALTPTALIARLIGKDPLNRRIDRAAKSYWEKKEKSVPDAEDYERQF